ncbi:MAG TPA: alpha/beta hydrolase [Sphingomicrobium sp.]|nr:alpha/beta hydrolase [Sphingomicrobium sp.]
MLDRRSLLAGSLAAGAAAPLLAQVPTAAPALEVIPLWSGRPPGGEHVTVQQRSVRRSPNSPPTDIATYGVRKPTLTIVRPAKPNGISLLMAPGGGYERVAMASDGGDIARYFADRGFTVGALLYRLPYDGWAAGPAAPLQDAQRAFRILKRMAPGKLGVMGFSAGGHVAGELETSFAERTYPKLPDEDDLPTRPDFAGLFFPVITMADPYAHEQSRKNLLGANPTPAQIRRWSVEQNVRPDTPPTFVSAATDDRVVPVQNSLMMYSALLAAKVPSALHVFDSGGHGIGPVSSPSGPGHFWPILFLDWLSRQKI